MALHRPKKPVNTEPSEFDKLVKKMTAQLDEQTKQLADLNNRMDTLIASDKQVHDKIDNPKPEEPKPEEPKPEEPDGSDKKDEHEEKIENA